MFRIKIACRCLKLSFLTRESFLSGFLFYVGKGKTQNEFKIQKKCTRIGQMNSIFPSTLVKENKDR